MVSLLHGLDALRELNMASLALRLIAAMLFGSVIGLDRFRKGRAAGLRTYMLVCLGAALTMLLGQYEVDVAVKVMAGAKADISRFGAQVINGVGFLGAGCIIVTGQQKVRGITTAASLWTAACTGLVIGAAFYECALFVFCLVFLIFRCLPPLERFIVERTRGMSVYVELERLERIGNILNCVRSQEAQIYEVDFEDGQPGGVGVVISLRLKNFSGHDRILDAIAALEGVRTVHAV